VEAHSKKSSIRQALSRRVCYNGAFQNLGGCSIYSAECMYYAHYRLITVPYEEFKWLDLVQFGIFKLDREYELCHLAPGQTEYSTGS